MCHNALDWPCKQKKRLSPFCTPTAPTAVYELQLMSSQWQTNTSFTSHSAKRHMESIRNCSSRNLFCVAGLSIWIPGVHDTRLLVRLRVLFKVLSRLSQVMLITCLPWLEHPHPSQSEGILRTLTLLILSIILRDPYKCPFPFPLLMNIPLLSFGLAFPCPHRRLLLGRRSRHDCTGTPLVDGRNHQHLLEQQHAYFGHLNNTGAWRNQETNNKNMIYWRSNLTICTQTKNHWLQAYICFPWRSNLAIFIGSIFERKPNPTIPTDPNMLSSTFNLVTHTLALTHHKLQ